MFVEKGPEMKNSAPKLSAEDEKRIIDIFTYEEDKLHQATLEEAEAVAREFNERFGRELAFVSTDRELEKPFLIKFDVPHIGEGFEKISSDKADSGADLASEKPAA